MYLTQAIYLIEKTLDPRTKGLTRQSFQQYLIDNEYSYSKNTITRILKYIENEFGIKLKAKRSKNPELNFYYIDEKKSDPDYLQRYNLIKYFGINKIISNNFIEQNDLKKYFSISNEKAVNIGIDYLDEILKAIISKKQLQVTYQSFFEDKPLTHIIEPVLLREYLNRWYVIANRKPGLQRIQPVFALDRIKDLKVLKTTFSERQDFSKEYENTLGASLTGEVKKVVFEVSDQQHNYFQTLPFHSSQKHKIKNGKHIYTFSLRVNYELKQWIKHYGNEIKVLKPKALQKEIKDELKKLLKKYK